MFSLKTLEEHHIKIETIISQIRPLLDINLISENYVKIHDLILELSNTITLHHGMLLKFLYTESFKEKSDEKKGIVKDFILQLGNIGVVLKNFMREWLEEDDNINKYVGEFLIKCHGIFVMLTERLKQEREVLVPIMRGKKE